MAPNSYRIPSFLALGEDSFIYRLAKEHHARHAELASGQDRAWKKEYSDLKTVLQGKDGRVIFEYSIPGLPRVIDVVLLFKGIIFVIEYKVGESNYSDADKKQVNGYALRLKYFHSLSNDNWIIPILVATEAEDTSLSFSYSQDDMVFDTICCNSSQLASVVIQIEQMLPSYDNSAWEDQRENGIYKQSPTIIAAARNVWRLNNVRGFTLGESDERCRLSAENYIVNTVVEETKKRPESERKSICFVTGVPGAGKTLVGLNLSVTLQSEVASMLSGNDPLVEVLTTALRRDLEKHKNELTHERDSISVESIIRKAYGYKKEIFELRLNYQTGTGKVSLRPGADRGSQHVIIFDEAQRAWNKAKMIKPGQTGKKYWQEPQFPFSEPGLLLWDMNQRDWGVFVCLVGGGQEINAGEAGICEWLRALNNNPELSGWHVYIADELTGEEYNRPDEDGHSITYYLDRLKAKNLLIKDSSLHLATSQRSNRSDKVASFVQALLDCDTLRARSLYENIKETYPIYLTRDLEMAKKKIKERKKQLDNRAGVDPEKEDEIRIGMLMSSKAARMRPMGYEIKKVSNYLKKVPNWFLDPSDVVDSSDYLEVALNEFCVQGLELDLAVVMWDADFRYNPDKNDWDYYNFNGRYWSPIDKDEEAQEVKRFYLKNAYRVLLTRSRAGMVIYIPEGSGFDENGLLIDKTRNPLFYEATYEYLNREIRIQTLDHSNVL